MLKSEGQEGSEESKRRVYGPKEQVRWILSTDKGQSD